MITKKLRQQRNWSQEQLAQFSGLSLRTIQRIESGHKASLESLKSIAAVFDVDVATLEQKIIVIDKKSNQWKKNPLWVRGWFLGSNAIKHRRKDVLKIELFCVIAAIFSFILSLVESTASKVDTLQILSTCLLFGAYGMFVTTRLGDKHSIW